MAVFISIFALSIIILFYIFFTPWKLFTSALADGLSLESEW